jgi:hypothetical protein
MGEQASTSEISKTIHWTDKLEDYFASTGEKAHCLAWVHKRGEEMFSKRKTFIDLPVIVGSGVIAFLNAGSQSMFNDARLASISLGVGSLVVGILNTMGTYFGWAKRAEGHRISSIHYAKLYRFIAIEMSLPRDERMSPHDLLKFVKDQYDRLAEISPMVPPEVIARFKREFKKHTNISKPEETNGLEKISVYREPGYVSEDDEERRGTLSPKESFSVVNPMQKRVAAAIKPSKIGAATIRSIEEASITLPEIPASTLVEAANKKA